MIPAISIEPLTPALGAMISGVDLKRLVDSEFGRIYDAWLKYKVIFIREHDLSIDELCEFSMRFGDLMQLPYVSPMADYPYVIKVIKEAGEINMGVFGGEWHSDFSFLAEPPMTSILMAEESPAVGGDTLWVDMVRAWQTLPSPLDDQLRSATAIHTGTPYGVANAPAIDERSGGSIEIQRHNPEVYTETRHPAVCRHPQTGEQMLFINPAYTTRLEGLSEIESERLLAQVYRHCLRPEFGCRFRWQPGTLAMWDNRNTMHYAVNDYDGYRRVMYRTIIKGHAPIQA
jgi:taurine dioxygenase